MTLRDRLREDRYVGVRFALNVALGTTLVWLCLERATDAHPIWAIASMIASADPVWSQAKKTFRARIVNAGIGGLVGLAFLVIGHPHHWKLPIALALTTLLSTYVVRVQTMWRQAPITAAIVIAAGLQHHSKVVGAEFGAKKVVEVMFGCLVGVTVSWVMARVFPIPPAPAPGVPGPA